LKEKGETDKTFVTANWGKELKIATELVRKVETIGIEVKELYPEKTVLYVNANKFQTQFTESIRNNNKNDFLHFYPSDRSNFCVTPLISVAHTKRKSVELQDTMRHRHWEWGSHPTARTKIQALSEFTLPSSVSNSF
jgi:hypothetical protein